MASIWNTLTDPFKNTIITFFVILCASIVFFPTVWYTSLSGNGLAWNINSIRTSARVFNNSIISSTCSLLCNCGNCNREDRCYNGCDYCYVPCWNGTLQVQYSVDGILHNFTLVVYKNYLNYTILEASLSAGFPLNSTFDIYYNKNNVTDIRRDPETSGFSYLMYFFLMVLMIVILIGIIIALIIEYYRNGTGYFLLSNVNWVLSSA